MDFDRDPPKDEKVRDQRHFGFADATGIFLGRVVEWQDTRRDDGETRMVAVGEWDGDFYTVVHTDRLDAQRRPVRWIGTAWPANRKERALWRRSA